MTKTIRVWVYPPDGDAYGFPKYHDGPFYDEEEIEKWLIMNGYPQSRITRLGKFFRSIEFKVEE
jgi:hypothetical protein